MESQGEARSQSAARCQTLHKCARSSSSHLEQPLLHGASSPASGHTQQGEGATSAMHPTPPLPPEKSRPRSPVKHSKAAAAAASTPGKLPAWDLEDEEGDVEFEEEEPKKRVPLYKRAVFWHVAFSLTFTLAFTVAAILVGVENGDQRLANSVLWWRLLMFVATLVPIWWLGYFFGMSVVWVTEEQFFNEAALHWVYTLRKPLANVLRALLLLASWAGCMYEPQFKDRGDPDTPSEVQDFYDVYIIIVKVCVCIVLFMLAELFKVLLAKTIANKFNREAHVKKMQAAIKQEYYLHELLQPRSEVEDSEDEEGDKGEEDAPNGGAGKGRTLLEQRSMPNPEHRMEAPEQVMESGASWPMTPAEARTSPGLAAIDEEIVLNVEQGPESAQASAKGSAAGQPKLKVASREAARQSFKGKSLLSRSQGRHYGSKRSLSLDSGTAMAAKMAKMEKYIRQNALSVTFYDALNKTERKEKMTSELEAKKIAFYLFHNVKEDPDRAFIVKDDLAPFLPAKDIQGAYDMLDKDGNGRVTLPECAGAVLNVYKQREYLAASLKGTKTIVKKLAFMIGLGIHIPLFFIYLLILGLNAWKVFLAIVPLLGAVSFALGSSIKQMVDNSIFLFITHPFDLGDTILLNDTRHQVEEITLPCTVLLRTSDSTKIWFPNNVLINIPIQNLTMSPTLTDTITLLVDSGTPYSVIDEMQEALQEYAGEHPQDMNGRIQVYFEMAKDGNRPNKLAMKIKAGFNYNILSQRCYPAKSSLFHFVVNKLREMGVDVTNPPQPVVVQGGFLQQGVHVM